MRVQRDQRPAGLRQRVPARGPASRASGASRATWSQIAARCDDIADGHHFRPTQAEASAISLKRGMDNECIDFFAKVTDDHDYAPYIDAVKQGYLKESDIDVALMRLFTARMKLGMFDPPEMVPYYEDRREAARQPQNTARWLASWPTSPWCC